MTWWQNIAETLMPGCRHVDSIENETLVVCFKQASKHKHWHWYQLEAIPATAIRTITFQCIEGQWYSCGYKNKRTQATFDSVLGAVQSSKLAVVPVEGALINFDGQFSGEIPVFIHRLYGPDWLTKGPQALAQAFQSRYGGCVLATDVQWDFNPVGQTNHGFAVFPTWSEFEAQLYKIPEFMRTFYECIPSDVAVPLYMDFDGDLKEFPQLYQMTKQQIVSLLIECIEDEFTQCYGGSIKIFYVFDSSSVAKISLHLVGSNVRWQNTAALASFIKRVRPNVFKQFALAPNLDRRDFLVDMSVYDCNSKFRLPFCTKMHQGRFKTLYGRLAYNCYQDMLVNQPHDDQLILLESLVPTPCQESRLEMYPALHYYLQQYSVPVGSPHTLRWRRFSAELFMVPVADLTQLSLLLQPPLCLDEAPSSGFAGKIKLVLDFDKVSMSKEEAILIVCRYLCDNFKLPQIVLDLIDCDGREPNFSNFHVAFQLSLNSYQHYRSLVRKIKQVAPFVDAASAIRTLGSDKLDRNTGKFAGRPMRYGHAWVYNGVDLVPLQREFTFAEQWIRCSTLAGTDQLITLQVEHRPSPKLNAVPLSSDSPWLLQQWLAQIPQRFHAGFRLTKVLRVDGTYVETRTNLKYCPFNHRSNGDHWHQHQTQTLKARFYNDHWNMDCWGSGCNGYIQFGFTSESPFKSSVPRKHFLGELAVQIFPQDIVNPLDCWVMPRFYFGPKGDGSVDYQVRGPTTLARRDKTTNTWQVCRLPPDLEQWERFQRNNSGTLYCFKVENARKILELCDSFVGLVGSIDMNYMAVRYKAEDGSPFCNINLRQMSCKEFTLPYDLRSRCLALLAGGFCVPPAPKASHMERVKEWQSIGIAPENIHYIDQDPTEDVYMPMEVNAGDCVVFDVVMGGGKTQLARQMLLLEPEQVFQVITGLRALARNGAETFNVPCHLKDDSNTVRSAKELSEMDQVSIVINSLHKIASKKGCGGLRLWDEWCNIVRSPLANNQSAKSALSMFTTMCDFVKDDTGVQLFGDAFLEPKIEGWLLLQLIEDPTKLHVVIRDAERNPWDSVKCYEFLGNEAEKWLSYDAVRAEARLRNKKLFMPCNEEYFVSVSKELAGQDVERCAFLSGSSTRDAEFLQLTSSTNTWPQYDQITCSPVLANGVSHKLKTFSVMVNAIGNRSTISTANAQVWLRQREPFDEAYFLFRNRGAPQEVLTTADLDNLKEMSGQELAVYANRHNIKYADADFSTPMKRLFVEFQLRVSKFEAVDKANHRGNSINLLNKRGATLHFKAPMVHTKKEIDDMRTLLWNQRKTQRKIEEMSNARVICKDEAISLAKLRQRNQLALPQLDEAALDRYYFCKTHKVSNQPAYEAMLITVYKEKLPECIARLNSTILQQEHCATVDREQMQREQFTLVHQNFQMAQLAMTRRILTDILLLNPEWLCDPNGNTDHLQDFIMDHDVIDERNLHVTLSDLFATKEYVALNRKDPLAFPLFGTSKVETTKVKNWTKSFLRNRAIPVVRLATRARIAETKRRKYVPRLVLDVPTYVHRLNPPPPLDTIECTVTQLQIIPNFYLINGHYRVPRYAKYPPVYVLHDKLDIYQDGVTARWAWFLSEHAVRFDGKPSVVDDLIASRQLQRVTHFNQLCCVPKVRINLIEGTIEDVSTVPRVPPYFINYTIETLLDLG